MTPLYHSNIFTVVTRSGPGRLDARSTLLATGWEATASINAATATFIISDASWIVCRSPGAAHNGSRAVPALAGVAAGLGSGPALRAAAREEGDVPYRLLVECVKGIIQSETYLFGERGFSDAETFEKSWKENYTGSCRRYSDRSYEGRSWYEHVANRAWSDLLFTRAKTAVVTEHTDGSADIAGSFTDSYHELDSRLSVVGGVITAAQGAFLRAPDKICAESAAAVASLSGTPLASLGREEVVRRVGGHLGCVHMADLITHMLQTFADTGR
ncbi:DUF2889 domain-containing protein [Anaeroselena agilis]|uniref:DUF2889 domain-containing protein n=1 Tax=Anaeroselena agilis TaxID=3063788 RepID=A0ABU3P2K4_9FIRM|nr:DUF2889 domain-containing protein [Selenomonadales bacterium 4137-cl]